MPKRVLGYGPVARPAGRPPQERGRASRPSTTPGNATSKRRSSSQNRSSDILLMLSRSCNKHAEYHAGHSKSAPSGVEEEQLPDTCRHDLETMRNLLPKVEKAFQPPAPGKKGPEANDVANLCEFYNSVLQGNYCPYAPHLFHRGQSPKEVITRVHYLCLHGVGRDVVATAKVESAVQSSASPIPVVHTLGNTIANLLSFLVDRTMYSRIISDLVHILEDCTVVLEGNMLPVKLTLFNETGDYCDLDDEYSLEMRQPDEVWTLEATILLALNKFLANVKRKRSQFEPGVLTDFPTHIPPKFWSGHSDIVYTPELVKNDSFEALLLTLRHLLLLPEPPGNFSKMWNLRKLAGSKVLTQILQDWHLTAAESTLAVECASIISCAVQACLRRREREDPEYVKALGVLLHMSLVDPPPLHGASTEEGSALVRGPCLSTLLCCIRETSIRQRHRRNTLDSTVLMLVHLMIKNARPTRGWDTSKVVSSCISQGLGHDLLSLLRDTRLSNHAAGILGALVSSTWTVREIDHLFHGALKYDAKREEAASTIAPGSEKQKDQPDDIGAKSQGRKRKRGSLLSPRGSPRSQLRPLSLSPAHPRKQSGTSVVEPAHSNNSQPLLYCAVRDFLRDALFVSRHQLQSATSQHSQPKPKEPSVQTQPVMGVRIENLRPVVGAIRFIFCLVRILVQAGESTSDNYSGVHGVADRLVGYIVDLSDTLKEGAWPQWSQSEQSIAECLVDCGIFSHFFLAPMLHELKEPSTSVRCLINKSAAMGRQLLSSAAVFSRSSPHSFRQTSSDKVLTAEYLRRVLGVAYSERSDSSSILSLGDSSDLPKSLVEFRVLSLLGLIDSLPLGIRCCILISVHPLPYKEDRKPSNSNSGITKLSSLACLLDLVEASDLPKNESTSLSPLALAFVRLVLSSQCQMLIDQEDGPALPKEEGMAKCRTFAQEFLESFLVPYVSRFDPSQGELCRSVMLLVDRTQTLLSMPARSSERSGRFCPALVLSEVLGTHSACNVIPALSQTDLGLQIRLRELIRVVAERIPQDHEDEHVRTIRWSLIARSVVQWKPAEFREHGVLAAPENRADRSQSLASWLLTSAFLDTSNTIRDQASKQLHQVVLSEPHGFLLSHFSSNEEYQALSTFSLPQQRGELSSQNGYELENAAEGVASEFFREVDRLLHMSIKMSDSQMTFSIGPSSADGASPHAEATVENLLSKQRTAVRILSSLCMHANVRTPIGKVLAEKALQRLARLWAATVVGRFSERLFPNLPSTPSGKALAFVELAHMSRRIGPEIDQLQRVSPTFIGTVLGDIMLLSCNSSREMQFLQLAGFIHTIFVRSGEAVGDGSLAMQSILAFLEDNLPAIVAQFICEKDTQLLRLTAAFRDFVREGYRDATTTIRSRFLIVGSSNAPLSLNRKSFSITATARELDKRTKKLCLEAKVVERILPLIFINSDRSGLAFFRKEVLQGMTLHEIVKQREQLVLKGLVWELRRDPECVGRAKNAIKAAASILSQEKSASDAKMKRMDSADDVILGKKWVTGQFMYLLVNVIQSKWKIRSLAEKYGALRCLHVLLDFLLPEEASQHYPQVMATVNVAIVDGDPIYWKSEHDLCDAAGLRLYAVKSMSRFIRLLLDQQIDTVASNLTTLVVSLIPVLEDETQLEAVSQLNTEGRSVAVSLLLHLCEGPIGRKLAKPFSDIPFLPTTAMLEPVHKALRSIGVDFDNLVVLPGGTQRGGGVSRESLVTEGSGTMGSVTSSSSKQADMLRAMQKRLRLVCDLLDNENSSVRNVALRHLTDLLRSNRDLYHGLVDVEGSFSAKHFLTVTFEDEKGNSKWASQGAVTEMMEKLLVRCVQESDPQTRLLLAVCIGEVGALGGSRLGELRIGSSMGDETLDSPNSSYKWRLDQPPWHSQAAKYELQLVTRHLVAAMKAAPSSSDQHKIAFAMQQLLHLLDDYGKQSEPVGSTEGDKSDQGEMSKWLRNALKDADVYDFVEPYFLSEFQEKSEGYTTKKPPFFHISVSYFTWISNFCRWMIHGSKGSELSRWKGLFFACRTAIRTEAGLNVAEFILPLLILDRICFGSAQDELLIREELLLVLDMEKKVFMDLSDRRKAANVVFMTVDTLRIWAEREVEERSRGRSSNSTGKGKRASKSSSSGQLVTSWPVEETIERISEVLDTIPLLSQAKAAASSGMYARALLLLEMVSRKLNAVHVFEMSAEEQKQDVSTRKERMGAQPQAIHATGSPDVDLMKSVLLRLDDYETMSAVGKDYRRFDPFLQMQDSIREREASGDYEAALQDYERALQMSSDPEGTAGLEKGCVRCLLELGRFESVMKQVAGLRQAQASKTGLEINEINSLAVEAAWRLGRWQDLSDLIETETAGNENASTAAPPNYHVFLGKAILGLQSKDALRVEPAIRSARGIVMQRLATAARESYARSYSDIVRLQCLRELENASEFICNGEVSNRWNLDEIAHSTSMEGWSWDSRADLVAPDGVSTVLSTRIALARLCDEKSLEGLLFLSNGQRARKSGLHMTAENYFCQAQAAIATVPPQELWTDLKLTKLIDVSRVQMAKLKYAAGESVLALQMLGHHSVQQAVDFLLPHIDDASEIAKFAVKYEQEEISKLSGATSSVREDDTALTKRFASRLLRLTQWMGESGLQGGAEIMTRFRIIHSLAPEWEKGHFHFGKYVDSAMQSRLTAIANRFSERDSALNGDDDGVRNQVILRDKTCQKYTLLAMQHYATSLTLDTKHVYQALPRLLSLWFDLVSVRQNSQHHDSTSTSTSAKTDYFVVLSANQNQANTFMAGQLKAIPALAFYTAIQQLVSRVIHDDNETSMVVQGILQRVLSKYPQHAMWTLAWLKGSRNKERARIGEEIFKGAQKSLTKNHKTMSKLLGVSHSLFGFLQDLATFQGSAERPHSTGSVISVRPWQSSEVELYEFIPPLQAALSISPTSTNQTGSKDHFPRDIPRLRAFSSRVGVMTSKAKPKKLKAFAVPATYKATSRSAPTSKNKSRSKPEPCDIGEIHFLVKQEAKGDLRKDARVQDLNNVINRLMATSSDAASSPQIRRRLHLRTFAVTCLSEDIGILEWVPDTESMRSLVTKSYNPQTSASCHRRRGSRLANFGDATLRSHFEMCQNKYFKEGNLSKAATMFEDHCLRPYPPLLYWWFVQKFHDPHAWYEARGRFTLSAAAWSAIGHVIGLGDRHSENILVDTVSGECVHVDFDCIFDKGLNLPRPEVVPFRLTANMLDAFGPTGAEGVYTTGLQTAMRTLRGNRDTLLSVLEPFLKDPVIDWKRHRSQQKSGVALSAQDRQSKEAKRSIKVIDERLRGIYNLRNPNLKKYRRTDQYTDQDDELTHLLALSVEGQVNKMVEEATSHENLVQLYVGWMPWV